MNEEQRKLRDFAEKYRLCVRDISDLLEALSPTTGGLSKFDTSKELQYIMGLSEEALHKLHLADDNLAEVSERLDRLLPFYEVLTPHATTGAARLIL